MFCVVWIFSIRLIAFSRFLQFVFQLYMLCCVLPYADIPDRRSLCVAIASVAELAGDVVILINLVEYIVNEVVLMLIVLIEATLLCIAADVGCVHRWHHPRFRALAWRRQANHYCSH